MDKASIDYLTYLKGDDNGIVEIIKDHKDGLILYLFTFVNDLYIAEELMEDTFFKLIVKKPRYSNKTKFKTWLYTIARNTALDYLRKNKKISTISIENCILKSEEETYIKSYLKEERKIYVHKALKKLNKEYQQVLYLSYFEDQNNDEIARIMKKNKRQIENLLYRSKQSLKKQLEKEGFVYEEL